MGDALITVALILTIGGCYTIKQHDERVLEIEKEKTKQIQLQITSDSLKAVNKYTIQY